MEENAKVKVQVEPMSYHTSLHVRAVNEKKMTCVSYSLQILSVAADSYQL